MKHVVVRSSLSGVWFGEVVKENGDTIKLKNARRAHYWRGAISCSELAARGPGEGSRICVPVTVKIFGACEVIDASPAAIEAWTSAPEPK